MNSAPSSPLNARGVLAAAWPLFQQCWPTCLPLALVAVASSLMPGVEAARTGEGHGLAHSGDWWGLAAASITLTLLCYNAVLLRQISIAAGRPLPLRDTLRRAVQRLPASFAVVFVVTVAGLLGLALLVVPGVLALLLLGFAWHAVLWEDASPAAALARSIALARGRLLALAGVLGAAAAVVVVFVLLTGILAGLVLNLAGVQPAAGGAGLGLAQLLNAIVTAVPLVWLGAVSTVSYRFASGQP